VLVVRKILYVVGGLVLLVVAVALTGWTLPQNHTASSSVTLNASPAEVFALLTDFQAYPDWRTDVERVEVMGEPGAGQRLREFGSNGEILYRVEAFGPPTTLITRIEPGLPFGGTWTYDLRGSGNRTTLTITEDGEVYNPIFRFVSRFIFGHDATIAAFLADLEKRVG
jgi:uncharacterized protein YndB with AHSA1/START domain